VQLRILEQPADKFFGLLFPGAGNNAVRDVDLRAGPGALPAVGAIAPVEFLRQFFFAACALSPTDHCGRISSQRFAKARALAPRRLLSPSSHDTSYAGIVGRSPAVMAGSVARVACAAPPLTCGRRNNVPGGSG
jgi:hypothetical protein